MSSRAVSAQRRAARATSSTARKRASPACRASAAARILQAETWAFRGGSLVAAAARRASTRSCHAASRAWRTLNARSAARTFPAEASAACWCPGIAGARWGTLGVLTWSLCGAARDRCLAPPRRPRARREGGGGSGSARISLMQTRRAACVAPLPSRRLASWCCQRRCSACERTARQGAMARAGGDAGAAGLGCSRSPVGSGEAEHLSPVRTEAPGVAAQGEMRPWRASEESLPAAIRSGGEGGAAPDADGVGGAALLSAKAASALGRSAAGIAAENLAATNVLTL
mmetsp:Transcript_53921/g.128474  ORF Transcript_53921/g.128474 Transcript_53921/m.128474 type:complete len:286 (-) Transcript_53921:209-1066(-)